MNLKEIADTSLKFEKPFNSSAGISIDWAAVLLSVFDKIYAYSKDTTKAASIFNELLQAEANVQRGQLH